MKNKSQIWGFDMMIAAIILVIGLFMFYFYTLNYSSESSEKIDSLFYDAELISDKFLSEGYPSQWDNKTVIIPGIVTAGKIDQLKLEMVYNMTNETRENNFERVRKMFNTKYKFFFNLSKEKFSIEGSKEMTNGIGITPNASSLNMIKFSRVAIYENITRTIDFYIWE